MAKLQMQSITSQDDSPSFPSGVQKKKDFPAIPEGSIVDVEVVSVELRDLNPEFRAKYKVKETQEVSFRFKVISGDFKNRNLWGNAKPIFNNADNCRLRLWTQEILGVDRLPADYEFDTDHFPGLKCRVLVKNYSKRDGTTGDGVQDVLRSIEDRFADEEPF